MGITSGYYVKITIKRGDSLKNAITRDDSRINSIARFISVKNSLARGISVKMGLFGYSEAFLRFFPPNFPVTLFMCKKINFVLIYKIIFLINKVLNFTKCEKHSV